MTPFDPNVWGTVSDWFMVSVTVITAYYLCQTLNSQKNVQKTQNKLFEIENLKFKESVKPIFNYTISKENFLTDDQYYKIITIEIQNETNSLAKEIKINFEERDNIKRIMVPQNYLPFPLKTLNKSDKPYLLHFLILKKPIAVEFIKFEITYQDISYTKYKQNVVCIYEEEEISIIKNPPELIE